MSDIEYQKVIWENCDKGVQLNLVVSNFHGESYLHLRKYYLGYDGDWIPSKEGVSMPVTITNVQNLLTGLIEVCAKGEATYLLEQALTTLRIRR